MVYLGLIGVVAAVQTSISPHDALTDGAAVIGVVAFLLALPALGIAVRTDVNVAALAVEATSDIKAAEINDHSESLAAGSGVLPAPNTTPVTPPVSVITVDNTEFEIRPASDVPSRVLTDLVTRASDESELSVGDVVAKLDYAARARGSGNRPWLFGLKGLDELWRLSYGGRGKKTPTLRILKLPKSG